jgi:ADP-heptose:LPS heptosyltransferase
MIRNNIIKNISIFLSNLLSFIITSAIGFRQFGDCKNSILVINTEKLGDIILSTDFLVSLRMKNQYGHYDLLIPENYADLFNWKELGYKAIAINKRKYRYNIIYRLKIINKIRENRYSHVMNITQERGMINDELTIISNANKKTAMKNNSLYIPGIFLNRNNRHYTEIHDVIGKNEYNRLADYLFKNQIRIETNNNVFGIENISMESIDIRLIKRNYIIIAPMSSEMDKSWGLDNYCQLCSRLKENIVLLGIKDERDRLNLICSTGKNILNLAGKLSFSQIAYLIKNCSFYIGNDSGLTHLAHQLITPLIAIINGNNYGKFFPYKERKDAMFVQNSKLVKVTTEFVIDKINILKKQAL